MSLLTVGSEETLEGEAVMLHLDGELDISGAKTLQQALVEIERDPPPVLALDLRGLAFIDSSGLRAVLAADDAARRDGRSVVLIEGPPDVQEVFRVTLLEERFQFVKHPDDLPKLLR